MSARFLIGIDLGTTNSSLAYVDSIDSDSSSKTLPCPQWQKPNIRDAEPVLPSFLYFASPNENFSNLFDTTDVEVESPTSTTKIVGRFAETRMAETPGRVVQSAKSWLCHRGANPEEPILPWGSSEIEPQNKLSPVQVSAAYLAHFKNTWNASLGKYSEDYRFENQDITITVPASFDEVAQRLTLKAAELAGYPISLRLLEEPQAAFYHWLEVNQDSEQLKALRELPSAIVLVCDIGGGTTDFSLFEIKGAGTSSITRVAVSDHVLLGGDNIDLTIARYIENKLATQGIKLGIKQWNYLLFHSRVLKETLLAEANTTEIDEILHLALPSEGRSLLAQSIGIELRKSELSKIIIDGFFPICNSDSEVDNSSSGLREWGLPFAQDSGVSRHLSSFLRGATSFRSPSTLSTSESHPLSASKNIDAVLYTGGTLKPHRLRSRLTELLTSWQGGVAPRELENGAMELGVARGAAYYGAMRRSRQNFIRAGYAHSIYLELAKHRAAEETKLICILPRGTDPGTTISLDEILFEALVDRPVRFQTYYSTRRKDEAGTIVQLNSDIFHELPSLQTKLQLTSQSKKSLVQHIKVTLRAEVTELGLLQLCCVHRADSGEDRVWQLDFNLRANGEPKTGATPPQDAGNQAELSRSSFPELEHATKLILTHFGKEKHQELKKPTPTAERTSKPSVVITEAHSAKHLIRDLETVLRESREKWTLPTLRSFWDPLSQGLTRRNRSLAHETSWLTLSGWCLRPGFGANLDDHRIDQLWRVFHLGLSFPKERSAQVQWWIMWRRVAGGLDRTRQEQLYATINPLMQKKGIEDPELLNLAASLERISLPKRLELASRLVNLVNTKKSPQRRQMIWALERIGARVPLYAGFEAIIPPEHLATWFQRLEPLDWTEPENKALTALFAQLCRLIGDRHLDVDEDLRERIRNKLLRSFATAQQLRLLNEVVELNAQEQSALFGDSLPIGIRFHGRN